MMILAFGKKCLDELDVLGIQVDNYGFHRSSFPVRVAVHEVLPDCLRQSVFKNSHDVMTSFSVAADEGHGAVHGTEFIKAEILGQSCDS